MKLLDVELIDGLHVFETLFYDLKVFFETDFVLLKLTGFAGSDFFDFVVVLLLHYLSLLAILIFLFLMFIKQILYL